MENKKFLGWETSDYFGYGYINEINKFLSSDESFKNFRRPNHNYNNILEHITQEEGQKYLDFVIQNHPEILNKIEDLKKNDSVGNPVLYNYQNNGLINPTTLIYIKFAGDILKNFKNLNDYNLIEIGGGYGGLVRVLNVFFKFKSITLFDLPEALNLQEKYLKEFNIKVNKKTIDQDFDVEDKSIVISNYAWCECDKETRKAYINKVIQKTNLSFLAIHGNNLQELFDELNVLEGQKGYDTDVIHNTPIFIKINE